MKINPIVFEILVLSNNLALSKYQDRIKKEGMAVNHPTEYDIMDLAATFLDFLREHSETYQNGNNTTSVEIPVEQEKMSSECPTGPTGMASPETDTNNPTV